VKRPDEDICEAARSSVSLDAWFVRVYGLAFTGGVPLAIWLLGRAARRSAVTSLFPVSGIACDMAENRAYWRWLAGARGRDAEGVPFCHLGNERGAWAGLAVAQRDGWRCTRTVTGSYPRMRR